MQAAQQQHSGNVIGRAQGVMAAQLGTSAISQTEIDGELCRVSASAERLEKSVMELASRLYPVLAGVLSDDAAAPTAVMNSPMGQTLHNVNEHLYRIANAIDSLRARVQL